MSDFLKQISGLSPARLALLAKELKSRLDAAESARTEPVAVVGMSCRFPGDSTSPDAFWQLVREGRDAIIEVPHDRWDLERYYDADREAPGKMYAREGGFLTDVAGFDARFFGVSPREAISLDPQHRLLLEVSWEALENAGWAPASLVGSNTGVFVGITATDYAQRLDWAGDEQIDAYRLTGNPLNFAAGRLAYTLGLQGPALAVDTACSSSLVAIHLACLTLRAGNGRMALAGGVNLILTPQNSVTTCKAQMLSPDGRCKTFDEAADGIGRAEGCGVVVLKKLADALADRDHIHLVIRGSSVNQDGRSSGLTVPNGLAQQAVIRTALAEAGVAPRDVSYIEAHGTGTSLGDPIELGALAALFGKDRRPDEPLWVGSVKTNIGHTESAAGVAGVIKVALALQHETLPAHLHLKQPTTRFAWDENPLCVPQQAMPWPGARPRIAGISSFGGSGTNAHLVVAEAPRRRDPEDGRKVHALTLSAKTATALSELQRRFAVHLERRDSGELADICYTTNVGRNHFRHRLTVVAETLADLEGRLRDSASPSPAALWRTEIDGAGAPRVAFLFTGQGSQYAHMSHALYRTHPTFRAALDQCAVILAPELDRPLQDILFPAPGDEALLDQTVYTQPALFAVEYALAELWRSFGIEPAFVIGHSLGEYVAACIAGVFSVGDALKLVAARSRLMQALPPDGTMVATFASEARVRELIGPDAVEVAVAAVNGPENTVISGQAEAVQRVCDRLEQHGVSRQALKVSHAFHSPRVAPMLAEFEQVARRVAFHAPRLPLVSNVTGRVVEGSGVCEARYWVEHARQPVRFADGVRHLADQGVRWFLEVGPHPTLSGIAAAYGPADATFLPSLGRGRDDWVTLTSSAARLHAAGLDVRWSEFHRGAERCRTPLPVYPFERQRFWIDAPAERAPTRPTSASAHRLLGHRLASPLPAVQFSNALAIQAIPWLSEHRVLGRLLLPAAAYIETALAAAREATGQEATALEALVIDKALVVPDAGWRDTQFILHPLSDGAARFEMFSAEAGAAAEWHSHTTGRLTFKSLSGPEGTGELASVRARLQQSVDPQDLYRRLDAHGFAFGPLFRGLTEIHRAGNEALGRACLQESLRQEATAYRIHPVLLDACLQVFAVAAQDNDSADSSILYVPLGIERFELLGACGHELWSHVRFRTETGRDRETLTGDLDLYDGSGRCVGRLRGLHLKRIDAASYGSPRTQAWSKWLYTLEWREDAKSPPRKPESARSLPAGRWLIFGDANGLGREAQAALAARGSTAVLVERGESCEAVAPDRWRVTDDPKDCHRLLAPNGEAPPVTGIVYLWGLDVADDESATTKEIGTAVKTACGGLLGIVRTLAASGQAPRLWLCTRGAVPTGQASNNALQATLWGLARVITLEHPEFTCTRIDLDPERSSGDVERLIASFGDDGREDQIAWRGKKRSLPRLERYVQPQENALLLAGDSGWNGHFAPDATYLITGGLGGLGLGLAAWMVERGARSLVLMGRTAAKQAALQIIDELRGNQAEVEIAQGDVADESDVARVLASIAESGRPLRGVFHAAAELADGTLLSQTWERFQRVMNAKVAGAWNLHRHTRGLPLDHFVLFSSASGLLGSPGQGNYAAANAFLDALAHRRRQQQLPAISIDWGAWGRIGAAARHGVGERVAAQGIGTIEPEDGFAILDYLLRRNPVQVAAIPIDWNRFLGNFSGERIPPFLSGWRQADGAESGGRAGGTMAEAFRQRLQAASRGRKRGLILDLVRSELARVLRLRPDEPIELRQPFTDMGLDSLMAVELRNSLGSILERSLPATILFDHTTVDALSEFLCRELHADAESARGTAPLAEGALDDLSEKELADLLAGKLAALSEEDSQ